MLRKLNMLMKVNIGRKEICYMICGAFLLLALSIFAGNSITACICSAVAGAAGGIAIPVVIRSRDRKRDKRLIDMDMADYMASTSLLLEAGLTLWTALRRASEGYDMNRPLFRELCIAFDEYDSGKASDQVEAFERMSVRCGIPSISMLVYAVVQNHKKGSKELSSLFTELSRIYRSERKQIASRMADEASTLLLIPSSIVLVGMIILLLAPAILELTGI